MSERVRFTRRRPCDKFPAWAWLAFALLFVVLVAMALAAPIWAHDVAHTDASSNHLTETIKEGDETVT